MIIKYITGVLLLLTISCSNGGQQDNSLEGKNKDQSSAFDGGGSVSGSGNTVGNNISGEYTLSVKLTPYIPSYPDLGDAGKQLLSSKINAAVSKIGYGGDGGNPRFIIGPSINLLSKNITSTSPTKYANTYSVELMVCDVATETIFSSYSFEIKGVGDSPEKAFINGFRDFNLMTDEFYKFLTTSEEKILAYYEKNCASFILEADAQAGMRNYDAAFTLLNNIPLESKSCYTQVSAKKKEYFQQKLNTDCQSILASMKAELGKSNDPSASGFNSSAMSYYSMIDRSSSCFAEAEKIYQKYISKLNPKAKRDWEFKMQEYQDKIKKLERDDQFRNDSSMANFDYLKHKDEMQAKAEIEGNKKLLQKYQYDQLPWLRKIFHLGKYDPFDGVDK
jgi:hypothetical protein